MILQNLQDYLFKASIRNSRYIFVLFWILYFILGSTILTDFYFNYTENSLGLLFYNIGVWYGRAALFMLTLTVIPGILGRCAVKIPVSFIITRYRRQFGITVFLLALAHYLIIHIIPQIGGRFPLLIIPPVLYSRLGFIALTMLLLLFLTSNSRSVIILKKWWKRLHRSVYVILWLVFLHVFLQNKYSFWTIWIGFIAVLEIISLVYFYLIKKWQKQTLPPGQK